MKPVATAENRPAYLPKETNQRHDLDGWVKNTHEDQRGIEVVIIFLRKVAVVFVGFALELVVEVDAGTAGRSKEVWKDGWQCFEHGFL